MDKLTKDQKIEKRILSQIEKTVQDENEKLSLLKKIYERTVKKDECFIETVQDIKDPVEILNWYRNLYYAENENTERGIMARAINDILPEYIRLKEETNKEE